MTQKLNTVGKEICNIEDNKAKFDKQIKRLLACKPILSRILKLSIKECRDYSYKEIESFIEGDIQIEQIPIEPGFTNNSRIKELSQEDFIPYEGIIKYDIRFLMNIPGQINEMVKIYVNIEAQKDSNPGYDIVTRGIYYSARMLSACYRHN